MSESDDGVGPVSFNHLEDGTPARSWRPARDRLPTGAAIGGHDHVVVVAAHPDDETLGAGALIADAARAGAPVTVVVATCGERSHPDSPTHGRRELAGLRRAEARRAVAALAPSAELVLLDLPDGTLTGQLDGLVRLVDELVADATVIAAPWRHDGHPDHEACGEAAAVVAERTGARLLEFPIWAWHWGAPGRTGPMEAGRWVSRPASRDGARAKAEAITAHRSQHTALSARPGDEAVLSAAFLEHFTGPDEVFLEAAPRDLPRRYFDRLYRASSDPWAMQGSFYETRKRALLLAALPRPRFRSAFEPGCATGLLTPALAERCDHVLAVDVSPIAVAATRCATAGRGNVDTAVRAIPGDWPAGRFDLVVLSEVGYYLADPNDLAAAAAASLDDDGVLVACHWRHPAPGYPSTAEQVHVALGYGLHRLAHHVEEDFLLDVWTARPTSVARAMGLVP